MTGTSRYTNEQLMAYADGELSPSAATHIRTAALSDPALAARIAVFTSTGRDLGSMFEPVIAEPVPDRLLQLLASPPSAEPTVVPLRPSPARSKRWLRPIAAAAVLAIAIGVAIPLWRDRVDPATMPPGLADSVEQVSAILENTPSGEPARLVAVAHEYELLPTASLRDTTARGRYCREFTSTDLATGQDTAALACRLGPSRWAVEKIVSGDPTTAHANGEYQPAGEEGVLPAGHVRLSAEEEQRLIATGWR
ncbi:MAG: anti-sigma factor family protein [Lysobacter sp.]